jgi:nucleoside-diphosphate-sugar epimerase
VTIILVAGAGGFIGGHLVRRLVAEGKEVRAVDVKSPQDWFFRSDRAENRTLDLSEKKNCLDAASGVQEIYNLASDMGGIGFIESHRALCMLSVMINTHLLMAARARDANRYFFASSACVYPATLQSEPRREGLKEIDAYPAMPEDGYGWEKLFGERLCRHFKDDFNLETHVARYHNIYGPHGTWYGGREKSPAAIARKVAVAVLTGAREIEIWGDGEQTRSFTYIDDCIEGTRRLMESNVTDPINIGSDQAVTINQLVGLVEEIAGVRLERRYNPNAPVGVRGRNSDNTYVVKALGWKPSFSLREGMERTYPWIYDRVKANLHL